MCWPRWLALDLVVAVPLSLQRLPQKPGEGLEAHIGRVLGSVGPSMLLCSVSEAICFFLGEHGQGHCGAQGAGSPSLSSCAHRTPDLRATSVPQVP